MTRPGLVRTLRALRPARRTAVATVLAVGLFATLAGTEVVAGPAAPAEAGSHRTTTLIWRWWEPARWHPPLNRWDSVHDRPTPRAYAPADVRGTPATAHGGGKSTPSTGPGSTPRGTPSTGSTPTPGSSVSPGSSPTPGSTHSPGTGAPKPGGTSSTAPSAPAGGTTPSSPSAPKPTTPTSPKPTTAPPVSAPPATSTPTNPPATTPDPEPSAPTTDPPASTPSATTGCISRPSSCGYPDATNTGPSGTLRAVPGEVTSGKGWSWTGSYIRVTGDGAVVENISTTSDISVEADNVTIRNVRVTTGGEGFGIALRGPNNKGAKNVTVEHSEIAGRDTGNGRLMVGIKDIYGGSANARILYNDISRTSTGVQIDQGLIEGNYIHDLGKKGDDHVNGTTSNGGTTLLTIRGNTVLNSFDQTDAISLFQDFGKQANRVIEGNLLAGGGYSLYAGANAGKESGATNIVVRDNRFSRVYYAKGGYFGPATAYWSGGGNVWSGNVWDDTGAVISAPAR